jgi:hypothetical protein
MTACCLIAICVSVFAEHAGNFYSKLLEVSGSAIVTNTTDEQALYNVIEKKDILSGLRNQGLEADEIEYLMEDYAKITLLYPMTQKDVNTITDMVYDGKDMSKILDIYIFLQDSNADLKYLMPMYETAEKADFYGKYWREDAFNSCAGQTENVLSLAEIKQYVESGSDIEDIKAADIVSRSEKKSAKEIIDELQQGNTWGQIIDDVYDADMSALSDETDPTAVLECLELSKFSSREIGQIYSEYKEAPKNTFQKIVYPKVKKAGDYIREIGLNVTDAQSYADDVNSAVKNILSDEEVRALIQSRYTKKEIQKAAELSENTEMSAEEILEQYKENNRWYSEDDAKQEGGNEQ